MARRFDGWSRTRLRREVDSRALETLVATLHGLRGEVDAFARRLRADDPAPALRAAATLSADVGALRDWLAAAGLRPPANVLPPEFATTAPTVFVEAAVGASAAPEAAVPPREPFAPRAVGPVVTAARWGAHDEAERSIAMSALVDGVPDGATAIFRVYERTDERPWAVEEGVVSEGRVQAAWRYGYAGRAVDWLGDPAFRFVVEVGGASSESEWLSAGATVPWTSSSGG